MLPLICAGALLKPDSPNLTLTFEKAQDGSLREVYRLRGAGNDFARIEGVPLTFASSAVRYTKLVRKGGTLSLSGSAGNFQVQKTIKLQAAAREAHVTVSYTSSRPVAVSALGDSYRLTVQENGPVLSFAPAGVGRISPDLFFRTPIAFVQRGEISAAVLVDVDTLPEGGSISPFLYAAPDTAGDVLSFGLAAFKLSGGSKAIIMPAWRADMPRVVRYSYWLRFDSGRQRGGAYTALSQWAWERLGTRFARSVAPQTLPFANYARHSYAYGLGEGSMVEYEPEEQEAEGEMEREEAREKSQKQGFRGWTEVRLPGVEEPVGGVPSGFSAGEGIIRWEAKINDLRSAWGLRAWSQRLPGSEDWREKSDQMLELALAAPVEGGLTPAAYDTRSRAWTPGNLPNGARYDLAANAWKGYWLLRFLRDFEPLEQQAEVERALQALCQRLLALQQPDGSFPIFLDASQRPVKTAAPLDSALPILLLAEMDGEAFRAAAIRGADRVLIPELLRQAPADRETQGTEELGSLGLAWAAEALLALYYQTDDAKYMDAGLLALARASMLQTVWPISYRQGVYSFGGFGGTTADLRLNDARGALIGVTLCKYAKITGRKDLMERGVAAVRSSLAAIADPMQMRNGFLIEPLLPLYLAAAYIGQGGNDQLMPREGFDWGEGSALASAAWLLREVGGAYVDSWGGWSIGIDGVSLDSQDAVPIASLWSNPAAFTGPHTVEIRKGDRVVRSALARPPLGVRSLELSISGGRLVALARPSFTLAGGELPEATLLIRGKRLPMSRAEAGFKVEIPWSAVGALARVEVRLGNQTAVSDPQRVRANELPIPVDGRLDGWRTIGELRRYVAWAGRWTLDTSGKGMGAYGMQQVGELVSPQFLLSRRRLRLLMQGGRDQSITVREVGGSASARASASGGVRKRITLDLASLYGKRVEIVVRDGSRTASMQVVAANYE